MSRGTLLFIGAVLCVAVAHAPRTLALEPAAQSVKSIPESRFTYPPTRRLELKDTIFGVEVEDPYRWLEDGAAPDVLAWMKAQDEFAREQWREIVPERADETLTGLRIVGNRLSLGYLKDVASRVEVRELDGRLVREVALPGAGSASTLLGNEDDDEAYYVFTSFTRATEIYRTSVRTGRSELWYKLKVPVDTDKFVVEQSFYASRDGTAPVLLYGYGGFNASMTSEFDLSIFPWLERGGVFAMPNIRGGNEYGEEWHRNGMRRLKQNVFDDFIAAAEHLISQGWTRSGRIAIQGSSNGGLLVGAALTQRPDLFGAAVSGVPLLDMLRYHLSGAGKTWIEEYGSADNEQDFRVLNAYSPYHRVRPRTKYPSVLLVSADSDDRVDPMHARKFAARLQAASTGGPVLLRIQRNAGHSGADSVSAAVEAAADEYAFALAQMEDRN